jgi:DNA-binding beta-propeller fold protein YncE/N-acetylneuraminic acid mutarotase
VRDSSAQVATPARRRPGAALRARLTGRLPAPVQLPAVARRGDGLLMMGGLSAADASVADIVRVSDGGSRIVGRLPVALHDAAAATADGRTLFIGGGNAGAGSAQVLRVTPGRAPRPYARLPVGASDVEAAAVGSTVYVVGGYTGKAPLRSIMAVGPGGRARVVAEMPRPLRYAAVAAVGGRVLIAGGTSGVTARREVLSFDPATGRLRTIGRLPAPTTHTAGAALNGRFYVLGGRGDGLASQRAGVLAIDPASGRATPAGHLPTALSDTSAASFADRIVVVGGRDHHGGVHDEVLTLDASSERAPAHRRRAASARMAVPRAGRVAPLPDPRDVYAAGRPGLLSPTVRHDPARVYVPNSTSDTVDVISQRTAKVIGHFAAGGLPQHVTPSWDLKTLWVTNDTGNSLTPIDPRTSRPGRRVPVTDPYNLYFTPDGRRAIVVAERNRALDFRSPHTMALKRRLPLPQCAGVDHMDYTADGRLALVSCEFAGRMVVVDLRRERVVKAIALAAGAMPQDVKLSPNGRTFYVADMASGGVWLIDAHRLRTLRLQRTGRGAHGLYPSRDSRRLFVSNRGEGSISVISFATRRPIAKWHIPGGGSPDMGGVSADGRVLWLSGRYHGVVYAISTRTGRLLHRVRVGQGPHGMAVWPQPGRYSIGHTGILR